MRRKYYVHYWENFVNTYQLFYAGSAEMVAELPDGSEQITRKEALKLASEEKQRRKNDPSFSGFADTTIFPSNYDKYKDDIVNDRRYECINGIWEKVLTIHPYSR